MKSTIILLCAVGLVACASRQKTVNQPVGDWSYRIVNTYPHDTGAYTQGLFFSDGSLWESTGEYGSSTMRRVDLETGRVMLQQTLADNFFGEGAALLGDKIYQLTWLNERAFVWDSATLKPVSQFTYRGQGWGLTTDGTRLYMSDGSANISILDPATFAVKGTFAVRHEGDLLQNINELEWIDGRLWANVYLTNQIVVIDPADGRVEAVIDLSGLTTHLEITSDTDVMNGIAHDPATGRIWVTGKRWNKLFEIEVGTPTANKFDASRE